MSASAESVLSGRPAVDTGGLAVDVEVRDPDWADAVASPAVVCRRAASAAYERAHRDGQATEISIVLADDVFVADLNRRYRGKDGATNVLSFPGDDDAPPGLPIMLGDIAVARETVLAEAAAARKPPADHLAHMIVHGVLHLLGHDHEDESEAVEMETLEAEILAALGIRNPYRGAWSATS